MPTAYADVIDAVWTAVPVSGTAEIVPYTTAPSGGYARPAPVPDLSAQTFVDGNGRLNWLPTPGEQELIDTVTQNPRYGMDDIPASVGRSAGSGMDNVALQAMPYAGDIAGGAMAGIAEYRSGGGLASAVGVGVGSTAGSIAGSYVGGAIGSIGGPVGTVAGAVVGGAIGGAIGQMIGDALIPDANKNGAMAEGDTPPFTGGQCATVYLVSLTSSEPPYNMQAFAMGPVSGVSASAPNDYGYVYYNLGSGSGAVTFRTGNPGENWKIGSNHRMDGGADNCGDPEPLPVLHDPTATKTKPSPYPSPELPTRPNPRTRNRPESPKLPSGYPFPNLPGFPDPTGRYLPSPTGEPIDPTKPNPTDNPIPDDTDKPSGREDPEDPTGEEGGEEEGVCNICEKLDTIIEMLDVEVTGEYLLESCEDLPDEENTILPFTGRGLIGLQNQITSNFLSLKKVWDKVKCPDDVAIQVPETWEIKKELNCPQFLVTTKIPDDKTSFRRVFSIPHPKAELHDEDSAKALFSFRRKYERGGHLSMLLLKDNSKIMLNCDSEATGQELLDWITSHVIDRAYLESGIGNYRHTKNAARGIIPCEVEFYTVAFYKTGKKSELPEWIFTIPE